MTKRRRKKRILAVVMSFIMVFSMLIGTNTMTASADDGETRININVSKASDAEAGGTVYYKVGDAAEWTDASPQLNSTEYIFCVQTNRIKVESEWCFWLF